MVKTALPLQGARVGSLVRELRSCMSCGVAKKKKKKHGGDIGGVELTWPRFISMRAVTGAARGKAMGGVCVCVCNRQRLSKRSKKKKNL